MSASDRSQRDASSRVATSRRLATGIAGIAVAAAAVFSLSSCSSGQISQTADQVAAVNGAYGNLKSLALRDVYILYPAVGGQAKIAFVITNQDPVQSDELESITTDGGNTAASISGDTTIAPTKALLGTAPVGALAGGDLDRLKVSLPVTSPLRPGLTYPLTFTFTKSGSITLPVPLNAGPSTGPQEG